MGSLEFRWAVAGGAVKVNAVLGFDESAAIKPVTPPPKILRTHKKIRAPEFLPRPVRRVAPSNVRSAAQYRLKSGIAPSPKGAIGLNRSRGRALRRAAWPCQQWMERWQRLT